MMKNAAPIDLLAIHRAFSATEHGKILASRVRYERYKPSAVTNERWIELLGPDVGNLSHLTFTYALTTAFVTRTRQNQPALLHADDASVLQVAALIHDWAEAKTGDISWGDKTAEDEAEEQAAFDASLHEFYSGGATALINRARHEVIFDHNNKLGKLFNAVERVGYMTTALRAFGHVQNGTAGECEQGFKWIVADVLLNQTAALLAYAKKYRAVEDFLARQRTAISAAIASTDAERAVFQNYGDDEAGKLAQFETAKAAWQQQSPGLKTNDGPDWPKN